MLAPHDERLSLMRSLMWDYNIEPEHCLEVLEGKTLPAFEILQKRAEG
jgi:hypothetical protein